MKNYAYLLRAGALWTYVIAFMIGSIYAQVIPTLSLFLVDNFEANAFELGVFFVLFAASTICVSQVIGVLSDRGLNRLHLAAAGLATGALGCVGFAYSPSYGFALVVAVFIFCFSGITLPQVMAAGREHADTHFAPEQIPLYNSALRASFALSWVAGPPLGFILQHQLGAKTHYLALAVAHVVAILLVLTRLPKNAANSQRAKQSAQESDTPHEKPHIPLNLKIGFLACAILFGMNQSYIIALPQLLREHLDISTHYTGFIMGTAAALEIPIMLLGGWLAARAPLLPLIRLGALAASLLYLGVWLSSSLWHLIALQVFNAIFVGFIAGLGMTWFQDQMPKFAGTASSLFNNSTNLGNVMGSIVVGTIAAWLGYHHMYGFNAVFTLVAVALLFLCKEGSVEAKDTKPA